MLEKLNTFDVIWLSELKTELNAHLPGFKAFRNTKRYKTHGGICLYIKYSLVTQINVMRFDGDDGVWVSFFCTPNIIFGGVYVPPDTSPYFNVTLFSTINNRMKELGKPCVLFGDFNAKIADKNTMVTDTSMGYPVQRTPGNHSGNILHEICHDNKLIVLNNLITPSRTFSGGYTYRQRNQWKSEIDLCILCPSLLDNIINFEIHRDITLPSDHAIISIKFEVKEICNTHELVERSAELLSEYETVLPVRKSIHYRMIDQDIFRQLISRSLIPIDPNSEIDINHVITDINKGIYEASRCSMKKNVKNWNTSISRWERLLNTNDMKQIWKAINWKGSIANVPSERPSDESFQQHFETLIAQDQIVEEIDVSDCPNIPVLDDPISVSETLKSVTQIKPDKASDLNGIPPGVFKLLPIEWIFSLVLIFNVIFSSAVTPLCWTLSKLIVLFKKGLPSLCENYRGITIVDSLFKVFERILLNRLTLWYTRTGRGQKGKGCVDHILTLRLICDHAKKIRKKLFIMYIDFEKAYDNIPRSKLFLELKLLGCGKIFLAMIMAIYKNTKLIFNAKEINAKLGDKQGAATSSMLFIIYIDRMTRMIKTKCTDDGFLKNLHILLLMDDTVLLSTTREGLIKKFEIVCEFCTRYGMKINKKKTKFMVLNADETDKEMIISNNINVQYTNSYVYLGAFITDDGNYLSSIRLHVKGKMESYLKYLAFLQRNPDFPFSIKKKVAEACLLSSLIYGCESWMCLNYASLNTIYLGIVKALLSVRKTTCNDLCLIEANMPSLPAIIQYRRASYLQKKVQSLKEDEPLKYAIELVRGSNTPSYRMIMNEMSETVSNISIRDKEMLKESVINNTTSSKRKTYLEMNPLLIQPTAYISSVIKEYHRIEYTRFRLSSHNLQIERGRWSRTPREQRLCDCGNHIQDERHALFFCKRTEDIRKNFQTKYTTLKSFFEEMDTAIAAKIIYQSLHTFK